MTSLGVSGYLDRSLQRQNAQPADPISDFQKLEFPLLDTDLAWLIGRSDRRIESQIRGFVNIYMDTFRNRFFT